MGGVRKVEQNQHYQVVVEGALDAGWNAWFSDLEITVDEGDAPVTTLSGSVSDQAALRGICNKLWDLNLTVISVKRLK